MIQHILCSSKVKTKFQVVTEKRKFNMIILGICDINLLVAICVKNCWANKCWITVPLGINEVT